MVSSLNERVSKKESTLVPSIEIFILLSNDEHSVAKVLLNLIVIGEFFEFTAALGVVAVIAGSTTSFATIERLYPDALPSLSSLSLISSND